MHIGIRVKYSSDNMKNECRWHTHLCTCTYTHTSSLSYVLNVSTLPDKTPFFAIFYRPHTFQAFAGFQSFRVRLFLDISLIDFYYSMYSVFKRTILRLQKQAFQAWKSVVSMRPDFCTTLTNIDGCHHIESDVVQLGHDVMSFAMHVINCAINLRILELKTVLGAYAALQSTVFYMKRLK